METKKLQQEVMQLMRKTTAHWSRISAQATLPAISCDVSVVSGEQWQFYETIMLCLGVPCVIQPQHP